MILDKFIDCAVIRLQKAKTVRIVFFVTINFITTSIIIKSCITAVFAVCKRKLLLALRQVLTPVGSYRNVTQLARGNCVAGSNPAVPICGTETTLKNAMGI